MFEVNLLVSFLQSHSTVIVGILAYAFSTLGSTMPVPSKPLGFFSQWAYNAFQALTASHRYK